MQAHIFQGKQRFRVSAPSLFPKRSIRSVRRKENLEDRVYGRFWNDIWDTDPIQLEFLRDLVPIRYALLALAIFVRRTSTSTEEL